MMSTSDHHGFYSNLEPERDRDSRDRLVVWKGHIMGKELAWKFRSGKFANEDDAMLIATWLAGGTATIRMFALLTKSIEGISYHTIDPLECC
jgi:hypothetical protein